ncbi:HlyD family secretion protein [Actinoplanes tereljensis]|uniref:RND transporter n=1 Tax=Paractinoplanes tereljensis TaxID=571912 RepID=A0A919TT27_9ACTN|nr:efflux RND transporter periplasmic adaptor subunit [Actinoplanes tereljensis]GIF22053.1 RND transporter [Actinoplanes tereljensis]
MLTKLVAFGLAIVAIGGGVTAALLNRDDDSGTKTAVSTVAVDTGAVTMSVAATGTVQASLTRTLSFTVDGTVEAVNVRAGSKVKAGAALAAVDNDDATDAVADAEDTLDNAEDQLTEASASPSPSASIGARAVPGNQSVSVDAIFTAQERVNSAKSALAEAKEALSGTTITAPIAGTVMAVAGTVGSQVSSGSTFITLADTYAMQVSASFPEADAGDLATGQAGVVTLADRVGEQFAAKVAQVDPVGTDDGTLVTYGVLLAFTKQPADMLVGQSASVEITTGSVTSALRVPTTAVHDTTVLVASGGSTAKRQVEVGLRGDQYTEIVSGLAAGEVVVRSW